jgi:hypothetical protein
MRGEVTGASSSGGQYHGVGANCNGGGSIRSRGAAGKGFGGNRPHGLRVRWSGSGP